ncbi:hypothetical protein KGQ24_01460, partial [Patescibacteria group bacterium]|nr:hypothetical protein [Patescibacteria group bacterium]
NRLVVGSNPTSRAKRKRLTNLLVGRFLFGFESEGFERVEARQAFCCSKTSSRATRECEQASICGNPGQRGRQQAAEARSPTSEPNIMNITFSGVFSYLLTILFCEMSNEIKGFLMV